MKEISCKRRRGGKSMHCFDGTCKITMEMIFQIGYFEVLIENDCASNHRPSSPTLLPMSGEGRVL
jgi:hypothetical protein